MTCPHCNHPAGHDRFCFECFSNHLADLGVPMFRRKRWWRNTHLLLKILCHIAIGAAALAALFDMFWILGTAI